MSRGAIWFNPLGRTRRGGDRITPLTLGNGQIQVDIDPGRGADILQVTDVASGVGVLAATPWRARADSIRDHRMAPSTIDPADRWLEQYRGGWQTLCPNAGPARRVGTVEVGFHGEASTSAWVVDAVDDAAARLSIELFSVPVRIERKLRIVGASLVQKDTLINLSDLGVELDYVSHPAFGGAFLDGRCRVETDAATFTLDPDESGERTAPWPRSPAADGTPDLRAVPSPGQSSRAFGWLSGFTEGWYSITNADLGLAVRVEWDARMLPHAWWWQELNASADHPWFRRARIMAIEPASTTTSGPGRGTTLRLEPRAAVEITIALRLSTSGPAK
ncbi:DUF4432 family protein [Microbacterium insulae]|uniref:DUF4432 family protein n=1 Tax=Microbacterium insulae TaxID=483014 RepID=A0ABW3AF75_9MICO